MSLIKKLFREVYIPEAVKQEVISGGTDSLGVKEIKTEKWIRARKIKNKLAKEYLLTEIHDGEAEVIILAEELKADIIIMDDKLGRRIAKLRGFKVVGTLRILIAAKKKGLIIEIKPLIEKLKEAGFWISDDVYKAILKESGE
jgi:predicted nucleic acid-binding protein